MTPRPHPFELVFSPFRDNQFPAIRSELGERSDINAFMLAGAALELLRELRPDDGLGESVDDFVALVHAAYLFWRDGERTLQVDAARTRQLCESPASAAGVPSGPARNAGPSESPARPSVTNYVQVAPQLIWGRLAAEASFEPLDGWFAVPVLVGIRMVACFGVHAERPGMSVVAVEGARFTDIFRDDGTPLFSPTMPGGDVAGLHAVSTPEELLLLGLRAAKIEEFI